MIVRDGFVGLIVIKEYAGLIVKGPSEGVMFLNSLIHQIDHLCSLDQYYLLITNLKLQLSTIELRLQKTTTNHQKPKISTIFIELSKIIPGKKKNERYQTQSLVTLLHSMILSSSKNTQHTQSTQPHRSPYKRKKKASSDDLSALPKSHGERQLLLTHFLKESTVGEPSFAKYLVTSTTTSTTLEQQIKMKDRIIMDLQLKNISIQADLKKVNKHYSSLINKQKQAFIETQRQLAIFNRQRRGQINHKMGFFRDLASGKFQEGEYLAQIRVTLEKYIAMKQIFKHSSCYDHNALQETQGECCQSDYLNYEIKNLREQLCRRERQVEIYKTRLKLSVREANCQMAKRNWPVLNNRYLTLELIGVGGFGEVYKAFDLETLDSTAIKISLPDRTQSPEAINKRLKYIKRECETHRRMNHPNIVNIIDEFEYEDRNRCLVMQYCSGPDLATYIKRRVCLPQRQARRIIKQLISVLKYLREQKTRVVHYDLKPTNILFHYGRLKVIDFGICKTIEDEKSRIALTTPGVGTYWYLPPEVFDQDKQYVSQKVDIWSIGVIFFEMLYGKKPFGDSLSQMKILRDGIIVNASQVIFPGQTPLKQPVSAEAQQFIKQCLTYEQRDRLGVFEAYQHAYLQQRVHQ